MITGMLALLLLQAQPMLRPAPQQTAMASLHLRRQRMLAEGHSLLGRAQAAAQDYNPPPATKAELDAEIGQLKDQLDSMSEMGET